MKFTGRRKPQHLYLPPIQTISGPGPSRRRPPNLKIPILIAGAGLVILAAILASTAIRRHAAAPKPPRVRAPVPETDIAPPPWSDFQTLASPVAGVDLTGGDPEKIFQPTASGRIESALYGSTRTRAVGKSFAASFHEGIDLAATARNSRGMPTDKILAAADGTVRYINSVPGNSNYGIYLVLIHKDPIGDCYTMYAHLAAVESGIRPGVKVTAGDVLGLMGNTPSNIIPASRAHLHLEIGLIQNIRFREWFRRRHKVPDHGMYHGWNLTGLDPMAIYRAAEKNPHFTMHDFILSVDTAFELLTKTSKMPDYFRRYPSLWHGEPYAGGVISISVSEGGAILSGRNADEAETGSLGRGSALVTVVDEKVLGRNGRRLISKRNATWVLGKSGEDWLSLFLY